MTKEEIAAIVAELDADLKKGEAEAVAQLKKDEGEGKPPEKEDASSPADESASSTPDSAPAAGGPPAGPDASAGGPPAGPDASAAPAPGGDPAAAQGPGLTPEALMAEYQQLPPEELDMHIQAALSAKEALAAAAGPAAGGMPGMPPAGPPAGAPPAPAAAPPMAPPGPDASAGGPPMPPPMGKEEMKINSENTGGKISAGKSISKSESLAALLKSQSEDIEILTKTVTRLLEAPVRKSVTSIADIGVPFQKTEVKAATRTEVDNFIRENAHKMTKSERDLWLDFVDNKVKADKLAPMLDRLSSK
jgi:hypothetical protein